MEMLMDKIITQIAIDGVDGSGKTYQIGRLVERISQEFGVKASVVKCPIASGVGGIIRRLLLEQPIASVTRTGNGHLEIMEDGPRNFDIINNELVINRPERISSRWIFLGEALHTYLTEIKPRLWNGELVILDRSHFTSNIAYGVGLGLELEETLRVAQIQEEYMLQPNLCIVLTIPYEESVRRLQRRGSGGGEINHFDGAGPDVFEKRLQGFRSAQVRWKWVQHIDANAAKPVVHERIWECVLPKLLAAGYEK